MCAGQSECLVSVSLLWYLIDLIAIDLAIDLAIDQAIDHAIDLAIDTLLCHPAIAVLDR